MGLIQFPEEEEIRTQTCTGGPGRRGGGEGHRQARQSCLGRNQCSQTPCSWCWVSVFWNTPLILPPPLAIRHRGLGYLAPPLCPRPGPLAEASDIRHYGFSATSQPGGLLTMALHAWPPSGPSGNVCILLLNPSLTTDTLCQHLKLF